MACVCENGGVLYVPQSDRYELLSEPVDSETIRALLPEESFYPEPGKLVTCSLFPRSGYTVEGLYDALSSADLTDFEIARSIAAVDVTPRGITKAFGLASVLGSSQYEWSDVLAIGDSWNGLPLLLAAGRGACPANAVSDVKNVVDYVSPFESTRGVLDIVAWASSAR